MLSYRHAYHAGNYADVFKHLVLVKVIEYLLCKPAPVLYVDTHAGAGHYALTSDMANKTAEYQAGIEKTVAADLPGGQSFHQMITPYLKQQQYPGSPLVAANLLRDADRLQLFELHSSDHLLLAQLFANDRRVNVEHADGYQGLNRLRPAKNTRTLVLIDPAYEVKTEYTQVVTAIQQLYKRMPSMQLLLWYPVVRREQTETMLKALADGAIRDIWRFELAIAPDSEEHGMTACGMLAINPPWVLADQLRQVLPILTKQLAPKSGSWQVECLVPE